ncbi:cell wall hydrolase [Radiobacillus deserti]|uniref:LysM peptidoglycan-binding domain-containing protein n=1 Tax=Radiobacillus deserti TaxID=2594883 RepID=A0A516KG36_9BACI|nr:cell wall hydrolase [Radiobacillus deserti]QDP40358.1 LysM peptidoglycan-binding domain-containing protein [Radiobacillus deserti]
MKKILVGFVLSLSLLSFTSTSEAASSYTVQSGDTLWKIGMRYGVSVEDLQQLNNHYSSQLNIGDTLTIPSTISASEKDLLARLVQAEAVGEPYAGKVAVATVVLNRVDNSKFPNNIKDVIYEKSAGYYAFTPVKNGQINQPASVSAKKAVSEALAFRGMGSGSLYFYNPKTAQSAWIKSRPVTIKIGNHTFTR